MFVCDVVAYINENNVFQCWDSIDGEHNGSTNNSPEMISLMDNLAMCRAIFVWLTLRPLHNIVLSIKGKFADATWKHNTTHSHKKIVENVNNSNIMGNGERH